MSMQQTTGPAEQTASHFVRSAYLCALAFAVWFCPQVAGAVTNTWNVRVNANWNTAANWSSGIPIPSDDAVMAMPSGTAQTLTITNAVAVNSFTWNNGNANHVLAVDSGGSITPANGIITRWPGTSSATGTGVLRILQTNAVLAGSVVGATSINASQIQVFSTAAGQTAYWAVSNGQSAVVDYAAFLVANVANSRGSVLLGTGGHIRSNQGLRLASGGGTSAATFVLDGGRLEVRDTASPVGIWRETAAGATVTFNSGTIAVVAGTSSATVLGFDAANPLEIALGDTNARILENANAGTLLIAGTARFVDQPGKAGSLTKTGAGAVVFAGGSTCAPSSYTGDTTVNAGKLMTDYSLFAGMPASGGTDTLANAYSPASRLVFNGGGYELKGRGSAVAGSVTGVTLTNNSLNVTLASTAGYVVGQSVANANLPLGTYIRRIINATILELSQASTNAAAVGQQLDFGAAVFDNRQTVNAVQLDQTALVTVTPGAGSSTTLLTFGPVAGPGGLIKAGAGTLVLSATSSYSGATVVSNGTLLVSGGMTNSAATVVAGAAFGTAGTAVSRVSSLTLAQEARVLWTYDGSSQTAGRIDVAGALTLPASATLDVSGSGYLSQDQVIFSAGSVTVVGATDLSGWTVNGAPDVRAVVVGNNVVLHKKSGVVFSVL